MKKILLVCGSGASSGFMARNISKSSKAKNLSLSIMARSESELEDYIEDVDLVLVGPHYKHMLKSIEAVAAPFDVPVRIIDEEAYGLLDGDVVLKDILKILNMEEK